MKISLKLENEKLKERVSNLEFASDKQEQYSRRNCLRISGVKEHEGEETDKIVIDLCNSIGVRLSEADIDRSHLIGRQIGSKPRQLIVKFTSYRMRRSVYKARSAMKTTNNNVFINEDLTRVRNKLFYDARQLLKGKAVNSVWSSDGVIFIKDKEDKIHRIERREDLSVIVM